MIHTDEGEGRKKIYLIVLTSIANAKKYTNQPSKSDQEINQSTWQPKPMQLPKEGRNQPYYQDISTEQIAQEQESGV
jgi:hypothetical protein